MAVAAPRLVYAFVWLDVLWIVTDPIPHGDVPPSLYRGLEVRTLLHLPAPSHDYVRVLLAVILVSSAVAFTGRLPRLAGWVCAVGMLDWVSNAFAYSKVDHDHFALMVALFVLPTVGAGPAQRRRRQRRRPRGGRSGWSRSVRCRSTSCRPTPRCGSAAGAGPTAPPSPGR